MTPDEPLKQRDYWQANLDPDNIGRAPRRAAGSDAEETFYLTPDQREALRLLAPLEGQLVLDLGAGIGYNARYLARKGATVVAADLAPARLAELRAQAVAEGIPAGRLLPVVCRGEQLPFARGAFGRHYSKSVLIHTDLAAASAELARTLKPGGHAVFVEPLDFNPFAELYRRTLGPAEWRVITRYFNDASVDTIRNAFGSAGESRYYMAGFLAFVFQFAVRAPRAFRAAIAATQVLDAVLLRIPGMRRLAWFTVIRAPARSAQP